MTERRLKTHYVTLRLKFTTPHTRADAFKFAKQAFGKESRYLGGVRVYGAEDNGSLKVVKVIGSIPRGSR